MHKKIYNNVINWTKRFSISGYTFLIFIALAIGILAGIGNFVFRSCIDLTYNHIFLKGWDLFQISKGGWYKLYTPLLPMIGGALLVPLALLFKPGRVYGFGFPSFLLRVNIQGGMIRARNILAKVLAAGITLGTGGSAGQEGPIAQIGGTIGSVFGQFFKMPEARLKTLIACGSAAGIAATFNAPIAGVFFAHEIILLGDFELTNFIPVVIASGAGAVVSRMLQGNVPVFVLPVYHGVPGWELGLYILLGVFVGLLAPLFIKMFYVIKDGFDRIKVSIHLKPVMGAFLIGSIAIVFPQVLGNGYNVIQEVLTGNMVWSLMLALVFFKMLATSITLGSGGAGGIFAPALYVGAVAGGGFGTIANLLFPQLVSNPNIYAIVGMGAFLAATTHAAITSIFLIFEMTNQHEIVLPVMFACVVGTLISRGLQRESIDTYQLVREGIDLHEGKELQVMKSIKVSDAMSNNVQVVPESMSLRKLRDTFSESKFSCFPVVDENSHLTGIISLHDFRSVLLEEAAEELIIVKDIATEETITVSSDESLFDANEKMSYRQIARLPVVENNEPKKLVGILSKRDILAAYNKALVERFRH
ncbi:MAG: chloride channel protein [Pseudomonadota bacterium]